MSEDQQGQAADFIARWRAWAVTHEEAGAAGFFVDDARLMSPAFYGSKPSKDLRSPLSAMRWLCSKISATSASGRLIAA